MKLSFIYIKIGLLAISIFFNQHQIYSTEKFVVEINVPHNSFFSIEKNFTSIKKGENILGKIAFKNNTEDGFRLSITSNNGGNLISQEVDEDTFLIPYILTLRPINKSLDETVIEVLTPELFPNIETPLLYLNGVPKELSYGHYEVAIYIEDIHNALQMAGSYEDSVTIKYSDL